MNKTQYQKIDHEGVCYRNTTSGPSIAEELSCVEAAELILNDEDGNILPDSEVIFGEEVGDTRGCMILTAKQNEIISEAVDNKGKHIPDIGHFIKFISNRFYKEKT